MTIPGYFEERRRVQNWVRQQLMEEFLREVREQRPQMLELKRLCAELCTEHIEQHYLSDPPVPGMCSDV